MSKTSTAMAAALAALLGACDAELVSEQQQPILSYDSRVQTHLVGGGRVYHRAQIGWIDVTGNLPRADLGGVTGFNSFTHPGGFKVQHFVRGGRIFARNSRTGWSEWTEQTGALDGVGVGPITGFNSALRADGTIVQHLARGGRLWSRTRVDGWSGWTDVTANLSGAGSGAITGFNSTVHPDGYTVQHLVRDGRLHTRTNWGGWSQWTDITADISPTIAVPITDASSFTTEDRATLWGDHVDCDRAQPLAAPIHVEVLAIEFNPWVTSDQRAIAYAGWSDPAQQIASTRDFFYRTSCGRVTFEIVDHILVEDIPVKADGFQYSVSEWRSVIDGQNAHHDPDIANYPLLIGEHDICGRVNSGQIDEVWLFGGPYFGFYETALVGGAQAPAGFSYNGPTFDGGCERLVSVGLPGAHTFGHRAEATLTHVFGGWQQDRRDHDWDRFGMNRAQSPSFAEVGCGSVHYAPNAECAPGGPASCGDRNDDYDFDLTATVSSYCDAFLHYPNLGNLAQVATPVTCQAWGCTRGGYERWWWNHLPMFEGVGAGGIANDWWRYVFEPGLASQAGWN